MSLRALTLAAAESGEPMLHPYVVGAVTLAILLLMLGALLAFGAGREHS